MPACISAPPRLSARGAWRFEMPALTPLAHVDRGLAALRARQSHAVTLEQSMRKIYPVPGIAVQVFKALLLRRNYCFDGLLQALPCTILTCEVPWQLDEDTAPTIMLPQSHPLAHERHFPPDMRNVADRVKLAIPWRGRQENSERFFFTRPKQTSSVTASFGCNFAAPLLR